MKEFGRLLEVLAPFRKWFALAVLLSFLTVASSVALVATSAYLISRAALVAEVAQVSIAITCVRVFAILRGTFRYLERLVSHTVTFRVLAELRGWFFAAVEPLAPARLGGHRSGDLLARSVADIETLESFYVRVLVPPVAAAMVAAFTCVLLGAFAWQLAVA
ncbi:MAG: thiol reductant ABC exporter subunit CydC, partial [Tepidiformaceae bacterium]